MDCISTSNNKLSSTTHLLTNEKPKNILNTFTAELKKAKSFDLVSAFVTRSGIASLRMTLVEKQNKQAKDKIKNCYCLISNSFANAFTYLCNKFIKNKKYKNY